MYRSPTMGRDRVHASLFLSLSSAAVNHAPVPDRRNGVAELVGFYCRRTAIYFTSLRRYRDVCAVTAAFGGRLNRGGREGIRTYSLCAHTWYTQASECERKNLLYPSPTRKFLAIIIWENGVAACVMREGCARDNLSLSRPVAAPSRPRQRGGGWASTYRDGSCAPITLLRVSRR